MPRSVSLVTTLADARSSPVSGLTGASQTFSTPSCGAIQASWVPSGEMRGHDPLGVAEEHGQGDEFSHADLPITCGRAGPARGLRPGQPATVRELAGPGWQTGIMDGQPEALIDLDAITANAAALRRHVGAAQVMAVVKSDAYGHGMVPRGPRRTGGRGDLAGRRAAG